MTTVSGAASLDPSTLAMLARLLAEAGVETAGELSAQLLAGGKSNLTYRLHDGRASWVLRMPPATGRTPSAHDVIREFRFCQALSNTGVPVPPPVLASENALGHGSPFAIFGFVEGRTYQTSKQLLDVDQGGLEALTDELVVTLARLHRVDHVSAGLSSFGRPGSYGERQLRRWARQWELVGDRGSDRDVRRVVSHLDDGMPPQNKTCIVHGDYRIDNTIVGDPQGHDRATNPRVLAVVDWELAAIGDPVADVAMMCAYRAPAFNLIVGESAAWTSARLPPLDVLADRYELHASHPLDSWEWHLSLAYFKLAVIAAGIAHRAAAPGSPASGAVEASREYLSLAVAALAMARP